VRENRPRRHKAPSRIVQSGHIRARPELKHVLGLHDLHAEWLVIRVEMQLHQHPSFRAEAPDTILAIATARNLVIGRSHTSSQDKGMQRRQRYLKDALPCHAATRCS
jgi:hypothetical protein